MLPVFELADVLANGRTANAGVALHIHVVPKGKDDGLDLRRQFTSGTEDQCLRFTDSDIDGLEDGNGESGCLSCPGLRLCNDVPPLNNRKDSALLDGGRLLEVWKYLMSTECKPKTRDGTYCKRRCRAEDPPSARGHQRSRPQTPPRRTRK